MKIRPYQQKAKDDLRESVRAGNKRIVIYAPTGAGKSVMALDLIRSLLGRNKRVAFIANRIGLVTQFSEHLSRSGIPHGVIQGNNTFNQESGCIVCSIDTVGRRGLPPVDYAIIDEAHSVAGSSLYKKLIFAYNNIYWFGLTATPFSKGMAKKYDEIAGEPLFQDMVITATIRELIDQQWLVDCEIFAPTDPDLTGVKLQRNGYGEMDYNDKDLGRAVDKPELIGDIVTHWFKLASGKRTVVFATNVAHSRHIVDQFNQCGIKAEHIDGYMDADEKKPITDRFTSGETMIISNVAMLKEGWDVPACECMILAKPTKSLIAWVQMVGRILRPFEGKTKGLVIDHSGTVHALGYPTDDLPLELCDGEKKEQDQPKSKTEAKKEKKCPKCSFIKKTHTCANCGFTPEQKSVVEVGDGELGRVEKFSKAEKQAWFSQLLCYAKSSNKSQGWVAHTYRDKFGVWPVKLHEGHEQPGDTVLGFIKHKQIAFAKSRAKKQQTVTKAEGMSKLEQMKEMLK